MSFILQFLAASEARTVDDAQRVLDRLRGPDAEFARRWRTFVASITEYYPDLSNDDTRDDRNLWPEGLPPELVDHASVNVMVNLDMLDEGVMSKVAGTADAAGLQILDPQNAVLYGPGPVQIGLHDPAPRPLPEITLRAERLMTENIRGMELKAAEVFIAERMHAGLGEDFERVAAESATVLRRRHGALVQLIEVKVVRSTNQVDAVPFVRIGFASDTLRAAWLPLLGDDFQKRMARYDQADGGVSMQWRWFATSITQGELPGSLSLPARGGERFRDPVAHVILARAARLWSAQVLSPFLDRLQDVDDLAPLAIGEAALAHCTSGSVHFPIYPAMLALASRLQPSQLKAYADAYRRNPDLQRVFDLFKDPKGHHFEALVKGLGKRGTGRARTPRV